MQDIVMNVENYIIYEEPVYLYNYGFHKENKIIGAIVLGDKEYLIDEWEAGEVKLHTLFWLSNFIPPADHGLNIEKLKKLGVLL